jgi:hypothetical protein
MNSTDLILKEEISIKKSSFIKDNSEQHFNDNYKKAELIKKSINLGYSNYVKIEDNISKNSKIISERESKKEYSCPPSQRNDLDKSNDKQISMSPILFPAKLAGDSLNRVITSDSKKSVSRVPNDSKLNDEKQEVLKSEKDLFKHTLYRTKSPKLLPQASRKSKSNHPIKLDKKTNIDSLSKYRFVFEDVENIKTKSIHDNSLRSSFKRNRLVPSYLSEECDLSNLNKNRNNSSINKTINSSHNYTGKIDVKYDLSLKLEKAYTSKNF